jgi:hypothetical protein
LVYFCVTRQAARAQQARTSASGETQRVITAAAAARARCVTRLLAAREWEVAVLDHVLDLALHGEHEEHDLRGGTARVRGGSCQKRRRASKVVRLGARRRRRVGVGRTQYMSRMGQNTAARRGV